MVFDEYADLARETPTVYRRPHKRGLISPDTSHVPVEINIVFIENNTSLLFRRPVLGIVQLYLVKAWVRRQATGQILRFETNPSAAGSERDCLTCPHHLASSTLRTFLQMRWAANEGFGAKESHVWV